MAKYLVRFDDINSRMNWDKFLVLKNVLEKYNIKSILGVVPNCKDHNLFFGKPAKNYNQMLLKYKLFGDTIAQHGFEHLYDSNQKGYFGSSRNSEFAGHTFRKQRNKLYKGKCFLEKLSLWEPVFMAPGHSFDENTLKALKELDFKFMLDGFSLFPFTRLNLFFIPQISSRPLPSYVPGISQLCIHINTISDDELNQLIAFIDKNHEKFITLKEIIDFDNIFKIFDKNITSYVVHIFRLCKKISNSFRNLSDKSLCFLQRIYYRIRLRYFDLDYWHFKGTFFCRQYKIICLKLINQFQPDIYIDIGCGLCEILSKVNIKVDNKLGYDSDLRLTKASYLLHGKKFRLFSKKDSLLSYAKSKNITQDKLIVISMMNFVHNINNIRLKNMLDEYYKKIGKYILIIDNIIVESEEYKYNHHEFLFNHEGLIQYLFQVDQLRSLYCIQIGK